MPSQLSLSFTLVGAQTTSHIHHVFHSTRSNIPVTSVPTLTRDETESLGPQSSLSHSKLCSPQLWVESEIMPNVTLPPSNSPSMRAQRPGSFVSKSQEGKHRRFSSRSGSCRLAAPQALESRRHNDADEPDMSLDIMRHSLSAVEWPGS